MKLNAYSIFDSKALAYGTPFFCVSDGVAVRMVGDLVNDLNTNVGRHPADFILFAIGEYEDDRALLTPISPLRHIADAISLIVPRDEPLPLGEQISRLHNRRA